MKKRVLSYAGIASLFLAISCSKEESAPLGVYQDDFVFYFEGNINGSPIELFAGHDDYSLETGFQFNQTDSVVSMSGMLSKSNSPEKKNALMLQFVADEAVDNESSFNVFESIKEGNTSLTELTNYKNHSSEYKLNFNPDIVSSNYNYNWTFENGTNSSYANPIMSVSALEYPTFWVTLGSDIQNGSCVGKATHWINLDRDCEATFIIVPNHVLGGYRASIFEKEGRVQSVKWYLDNEFIASSADLENVPVNVDGHHTLKAEISFYAGCKKIVEKDFNVLANVPVICDLDFSFTKAPIRVYDPKQRGTVELVYFDDNGIRYSSKYDNTDGQFRVHGLKSFENNDLNQKTARFQFEGNAVLMADDGSTLTIENAFGSFAIAHP